MQKALTAIFCLAAVGAAFGVARHVLNQQTAKKQRQPELVAATSAAPTATTARPAPGKYKL